MDMPRRTFLAAAALAAAPRFAAAGPARIKALAFDAFPIFDPRPVFAQVNELFPEQGEALGNAWRTRQFEYSWLRTAAGQYRDFWGITEDALRFAAAQLGIPLDEGRREQLMQAYLGIGAWPEVPAALNALKARGLQLALLSNMTPRMLESFTKNAALEDSFSHLISTDRARTYKPDPKAYQLGVDTLGLKKEEILFVAFAGWDAAGAAWFGYPTYWVNRLGTPREALGVQPDGEGRNLNDLVAYVETALSAPEN